MKTVCKTNIRKALRKAYDTGASEPVNIDWDVWFGPNRGGMFCDCSVTMENNKTGERLFSNIGGCTSMTELIDFCTEILMKKWSDREDGMRDYRIVFKNLKTGEYIDGTVRAKYRVYKDEFKELAFKAFKVQNPLELMNDYALIEYWAA